MVVGAALVAANDEGVGGVVSASVGSVSVGGSVDGDVVEDGGTDADDVSAGGVVEVVVGAVVLGDGRSVITASS